MDEFLKKGWIQPSHSPWVSRGFLVPKPNGKWRLVIDYRYVNTQLPGHEFFKMSQTLSEFSQVADKSRLCTQMLCILST